MNSEIKNIGKYKISGEIGMGAMGIVYKGEDPLIGRTVAIKTIRFDLSTQQSEQERARKRFIREARSVGNLSHPNIVTIYEVGEDEGLIYIAMEYVPGQSLDSFLEIKKDLSLAEIIRLVSRIGEALDYAHKKGVIHRDVKPANILVDEEGNPHLVDFGIARVSTSTMTQTRMVMGTPYYMSPEQISGKSVDNRADIFSFGVLIYEMLTRRKPFPGDNITTVIYKIINEEPRPLLDFHDTLPAGLERILKKALAKNPESRYQTCGEFVAELASAGSDERGPEKSHIPARDKKMSSAATANRKPLLIVVASMMAVTLVVIISVVVYSSRQKDAKLSGTNETAARAEAASPAEPWKTGLQLQRDGRFQAAMAAFQQVLALDPGHFEAQFNLAQVYRELGRRNEAINAFNKSWNINPEDPRPYLQLGEIYESMDEPSLALENFLLYTQALPENEIAEEIDSRIAELKHGLEPEIIPTEEIAAKAAPSQAESTLAPSDELPTQKKQEEPESEIEEPKDSPDMDPLISAGVEAFNKGDYIECLRKMEAVLRLEPDNNYAGYYLALARRRLAQDEKVKQPVPVKKKPEKETATDRSTSLFESAKNAYNRAEYAKAIQLLEQVLELDKHNSTAREYWGDALTKLAPREIETLVQQYTRALKKKTLVDFYRSVCLSPFFEEIKQDAELMVKLYDNLDAVVSNIQIETEFVGENIFQAEVSFNHIITGMDGSGINKVIFEGTFIWKMEKIAGAWRITGINYRN